MTQGAAPQRRFGLRIGCVAAALAFAGLASALAVLALGPAPCGACLQFSHVVP